MTDSTSETRVARVEFTGSRHELLGIVMRGYALLLPTLGLYRFWMSTWRRRFYWQNTVIDGQPLEYTGTPGQLLLGFFFALAFFLPIYLALFYFSMQDVDYVLIGYAVAGAVLWYLSGYAIYRGRDFRLARTLWRGIRFDLRGNAWAYGLRRFIWSILLVLTLGLIYPWMASGLWRYRWRHTWYGDRKFEIAGNWRVFAAPYFATYISAIALTALSAGWIIEAKDLVKIGSAVVPGPIGCLVCLAALVLFGLVFAWYRTTTASRMLSTVSIGDAKLTVRIPAGPLFWQYVIYVVSIFAVLAVFAVIALIALGSVFMLASTGGKSADGGTIVALFQSSTLNVVLLVLSYLVVLGTLSLLAELILKYGWWKLLAAGTTISSPDSLKSVRATAEDRALVGEGLADALNVGAY